MPQSASAARPVAPGPAQPPAGSTRPEPAGPPPGGWTPVHYVPRPTHWIPVKDPLVERLTRTDLRLALTLLVCGAVVVFIFQMPLLAQILVGAPLFEEAFKLGLALLPWAALRVRTLAVRLPTAWIVGAGFGLLEHAVSYPSEATYILYGRMAFHGLSTGLSMLVLHGLRSSDHRLKIAGTLPSTFVHAGNNAAAVALALAAAAAAWSDGLADAISLGVASGFVLVIAVATVTWPGWRAGYARFVEAHLLHRLGPPAAPALAVTPSSASRS